MVTSLKNLKNQIDSRLAGGGLTDLACCQLQNAQTILNNNIVYSVANTASLPNAVDNEGRFVYVDDIKEYRLANDFSWTDDVSSSICVYQNQLFAWGSNECGRLGDGTTTSRFLPVREFCSATNWCQTSTGRGFGHGHTVAVKTTGELWGWGLGNYGRLGDGTINTRCSPIREICSATDWCQVSTGPTHTLALKNSGQIWGWGSGACGGLGDGALTSRCSPVREFCSAVDWCQVSAATRATVAIKTGGELWAWGSNICGRLGDGTTVSKCSPVREICSATDWCQASAGGTHAAAVKTSGQLWAWGNGSDGRLGDGTTVNTCSPVREFCSATDWCQVSAGTSHTTAIKTSGELWGWGVNSSFQLGDASGTARCSPVREFCSATDWCQVSSGYRHSVAIKTSGQLWAWGEGSCGRLGTGFTTAVCFPVREGIGLSDWCQVSAGEVSTVGIRAVTKGFFE